MNNALLPGYYEDRLQIHGRTFRICPSVFRVLAAEQALSDAGLLPREQIRLAIWLLFRPPRPKPSAAALNAAFELLRTENPYAADTERPPVLNIAQDSGLIAAAFRQQYGIDLLQQLDRLDWRLFQHLLSGISGETKLGEIMRLRAAPIPERTAYDGDYRRELMRLKHIYAIRKQNKNKEPDSGLRRMAQTLQQMCRSEPG